MEAAAETEWRMMHGEAACDCASMELELELAATNVLFGWYIYNTNGNR